MRKEIEWIIEFTYALNCTEVLKAVEFICPKRPDFISIPTACRLLLWALVFQQKRTPATTAKTSPIKLRYNSLNVSNLREFSCNLILETAPKFRLDCSIREFRLLGPVYMEWETPV